MRAASQRTFRELMIGLGALVAAVLVQTAIVWGAIDHLTVLDRADDEARTELLHFAVMHEAVLDEAAAFRGYLIDRDPAFLDSYENARKRFAAGVPRLRRLAAVDPLALRLKVEDLVSQEADWRTRAVEPQLAAFQAGLAPPVDPEAGKAQVDAVQADFVALRTAETDLLERRDGLWGEAFQESRLTLLLGSGAALLFAIMLAVRSLRRLIAQQRAAQAASAKMASALGRANAAERAKTVFLANMSHEMRTPLNGVAGMAEALSRTDLAPAQHEMIKVIRRSSADLEGLIGNLLTLSRDAQASPGRTTAWAFHLGDELRGIADDHGNLARKKGLRFQLLVAPRAETRVRGDAAKLERILVCLLSNAIKFTDSGEVAVSVDRLSGDRYRFQVSDTGVGFDEARKAVLFETFAQSDDSATRRFGGAGLGLAVARRLADGLGGQLECHSTPGAGSVFALELDLPSADAASPGTEPPPAPAPPAPVAVTAAPKVAASTPPPPEASDDETPPRILVVDDNATNRRVLELILEQLGAQSVSVEDGCQAVEAVAREGFAAILMDIQMPVMDGLTATREIRRLEAAAGRPPTPVIIVSANGQPEHVAAGQAAGAQLHLTKPVSAVGLVDALNTVLADPAPAETAAAA
ncbi:MAG: ATP-binding protein [Phenylobacterium sp.]